MAVGAADGVVVVGTDEPVDDAALPVEDVVQDVGVAHVLHGNQHLGDVVAVGDAGRDDAAGHSGVDCGGQAAGDDGTREVGTAGEAPHLAAVDDGADDVTVGVDSVQARARSIQFQLHLELKGGRWRWGCTIREREREREGG